MYVLSKYLLNDCNVVEHIKKVYKGKELSRGPHTADMQYVLVVIIVGTNVRPESGPLESAPVVPVPFLGL